MKNRTVLGIICIALAILTVFVVSPVVNRFTDGETTVIRLAEDVKRGTKITKEDIEDVKVKELIDEKHRKNLFKERPIPKFEY